MGLLMGLIDDDGREEENCGMRRGNGFLYRRPHQLVLHPGDGKPAKRVHELAHAAFPEAKNLRPPNVARGLLTW